MCHRQHFMDETPFSLPKFSYSSINQDSGDCANIGTATIQVGLRVRSHGC